jgi:hypothetical protein
VRISIQSGNHRHHRCRARPLHRRLELMATLVARHQEDERGTRRKERTVITLADNRSRWADGSGVRGKGRERERERERVQRPAAIPSDIGFGKTRVKVTRRSFIWAAIFFLVLLLLLFQFFLFFFFLFLFSFFCFFASQAF